MTFRDYFETSYPFAKFASDHGLSYTDVLCLVDSMQRCDADASLHVRQKPEWHVERQQQLLELVNAEQMRKRDLLAMERAKERIAKQMKDAGFKTVVDETGKDYVTVDHVDLQRHTLGDAINDALAQPMQFRDMEMEEVLAKYPSRKEVMLDGITLSEGSFEAKPEVVDRYGEAMLAAMSKVPHPGIVEAQPLLIPVEFTQCDGYVNAGPPIPVLDAHPKEPKRSAFDDWYFGRSRKA